MQNQTTEQVLSDGGFHTNALTTEGIVFHANALAESGCKLTGGVISTRLSFDKAAAFAREGGRKCIYKIDLLPRQGVGV